MKKRYITSLVAGGLLTAMLPGVAAATPPDKFEAPLTIQHLDLENELVTFGNLDRADYCTPAVAQARGSGLSIELWPLNANPPLIGRRPHPGRQDRAEPLTPTSTPRRCP